MIAIPTLAWRCALIIPALLVAASAHAQVRIETTRVIFPHDQKEVSVRLTNIGQAPSIVQSWVSPYGIDSTPDASDVPFMVLPPVVRVDAGKTQALRLRLMDKALPADRESVFTLNVLDVPGRASGQESTGAVLNIAARNRIKVFYRPQAVEKFGYSRAVDQLRWAVVPQSSGWALQAVNDSPLNVTVVRAGVKVDGKDISAENVTMLPPKATLHFPLLGGVHAAKAAEVRFKYINDHGATLERTVELTERQTL